MALGKVGAFVTDAPLAKNYVGEALSETENQGFKYRAEQRLAEAKKKEEEDAKQTALVEHLKKFNFDTTMSQSINDIGQNFANEMFEQYADLATQLSKTKDPKERLKIQIQQSRIDQSFEPVSQIPKLLKDQNEYVAKNIKDFNPADVDIVANKLKQLENGKAKVYLEGANLMVNLYETDKDGKVTGILSEKQPLTEFIAGMKPNMKSNHDELLKNAISNTGIQLEKIQQGFTTTTNKGVLEDIKKQNAQSYAEVIANTPHEAYDFALKHKIDQNDKEKIMELAKKEYTNGLPKEHEIDIDQSGITSRINANKGDKKEPIIKPVVGDYRSPIVMNIDGKPVTRPLESVYKNNLSFKKDEFKLESVGGKYNDVNVETIGLNAKGVPFMTGTYATQKGSTSGTNVQVASESTREGAKQERFFYDFGPTELNSVAQKMGYKNGDELTAEVRRINNYKAKSKQQTKSKPNNNDPLGIL